VLRRFLARPRRHEFELFAEWVHEDNFGSEGTARLGDVDPALSFEHLAPDQLYRLPQRWWFWPAGAAAVADPALVVAADRVLDGAPVTDVGARVTGWTATLDVHSEIAASDTGGEHVAAVTANARGKALVRLLSVVPCPTEIAVRLATGGERVRVERIRARLFVRGAPDTVLDVTSLPAAWRLQSGAVESDGWIVPDAASIELALDPAQLPRAHVFRTEVVLYLDTRDRGRR
jgi:hypothetical protein